ncbi:hypothetical protein CK556_00215 [Mesoplasma chauliocola]|uniref:HTH rpiR-type domain-containing protein n=1 Tax=Mesoplasma chauliocola TaxID=216427 RepID=A0A249SMQ7_9MOLU|nr:hypothetical protein [Mesoplasma chauliocola]ASZ08791.1 hypothetical protein CK556_00215 [Mesoplasma chauliocola]
MESVYDKLEDFINNNQKNSSFKLIAVNLIELFDKGDFISQKELAKLSYVANSTITKFSQVLGYSGYKELLFTLKHEWNKYGNEKTENGISSKEMLYSMINWVEENNHFVKQMSKAIKNSKCVKIYNSYQIGNSIRYFYETLIALNKNPILMNNDYHYSQDQWENSEVVNIFIVCGKDNRTLVRELYLNFNKSENNFLIVSKIQQSKIDLNFSDSLVIDYNFDNSKSIYRNMALNILFLSIFQEINN